MLGCGPGWDEVCAGEIEHPPGGLVSTAGLQPACKSASTLRKYRRLSRAMCSGPGR